MKEFIPIDLSQYYNTGRDNQSYLNKSFWHSATVALLKQLPEGQQTYYGIPFLLGKSTDKNCWIILGAHQKNITIPLAKQTNFIVFAHFADSSSPTYAQGPSLDGEVGYVLRPGEHLANYILVYSDGSEYPQPIRRRFEINEACITWGHLAFASRSHSMAEPLNLRGPYPRNSWGLYQTGVDNCEYKTPVHYWIYALPNPFPDKHLIAVRLDATSAGNFAIAGITQYNGKEHPLRFQKLETMQIHLNSENSSILEENQIEIDQGIIARVFTVPSFNSEAWLNNIPIGWGEDPQTFQNSNQWMAEITANLDAILTVSGHEIELNEVYSHGKSTSQDGIASVEILTPNKTWMEVTIQDDSTGQPTPARVHFRAPDGRYLPPCGHRHEVNDNWFEDYGADLKLGSSEYAYVDGKFKIELPVGEVYVELSKGFEYRPIRQKITIQPGKPDLIIHIERPINCRSSGWVTADTHVHFISPETALLQAQGEGINLINLLASQWGDLFTNVGDITGSASGCSRNDTIVWVGTENRQHILGHISLLGTKGIPIFPMCTGGPNESYLGDPTWMSMADWADQCKQNDGVVISPHFPNPLCEVVADIILDKVDGIEIRDFYAPTLDTYSITEWYRYLNLGYHLAAVGGTDKMSAGIPIGGVRTYAHIGDQEFNFENWGKSVRAGKTYTTSGPLLDFSIEGQPIGSIIHLPAGGGTLEINASAFSTQPFHELQIVVNGKVIASETNNTGCQRITLHEHLQVDKSSWIAARCLSRYKAWYYEPVFMAAHTSPIYIQVKGNELFSLSDALYMQTLLEGGLTYLDTLSIPADPFYQSKVRSVFEKAQKKLHDRQHHHSH